MRRSSSFACFVCSRMENGLARADVMAGHHVLEGGHVAEQADVLEGAGDAGGLDHLVGLAEGSSLPLKTSSPSSGV